MTVFSIEKFATHDGPGIRTVVFVKGCPLRCMWCHSPESWNPKIETYPDGTVIGREMTVAEILDDVLKDRDFYEVSGGGLTVSGGEPLFRWRETRELLAAAKKAGLHVAVETSGFAPQEAVADLAAVVDLWLYDIKGLDAEAHRRHTGADPAAILRNLRWLDRNGAKIRLRCPVIPGLNDSEGNLRALGRLADELKGVLRLDVEPYVPYGIEKAHRLGLSVYEAPQPPASYGEGIVARLRRFTSKSVHLG